MFIVYKTFPIVKGNLLPDNKLCNKLDNKPGNKLLNRLGLKQQAISTSERAEESPTLKKLVQFTAALDLEIRVVKK
jgi:hypothetical protein